MRCEEALTLISAKIDGELTAKEAAELEAHLKTCADCRDILEAYLQADADVAALQVDPPDSLKTGVMAQVAAAAAQPVPKKHRRFLWGPGTAVAAAAAVLLILLSTGAIRLPQRSTATAGDDAMATESAEDSDWKAAVPDTAGSAENAGQPEIENAEIIPDGVTTTDGGGDTVQQAAPAQETKQFDVEAYVQNYVQAQTGPVLVLRNLTPAQANLQDQAQQLEENVWQCTVEESSLAQLQQTYGGTLYGSVEGTQQVLVLLVTAESDDG